MEKSKSKIDPYGQSFSHRYSLAISKLDEVNSADPNRIVVDGEEKPAELVYAERMSETLAQLYPGSSELLSIAVRAQHLARWKILRKDYPEGRSGYFQWRNEQKRMHAEQAGEIMMTCEYDVEEVRRVKSLIRKEKYKQDTEAQALEDVACVVFLKYYFDEFLDKYKYDDDKVIDILRKTWVKMSQTGQDGALALDFPDDIRALIGRALG